MTIWHQTQVGEASNHRGPIAVSGYWKPSIVYLSSLYWADLQIGIGIGSARSAELLRLQVCIPFESQTTACRADANSYLQVRSTECGEMHDRGFPVAADSSWPPAIGCLPNLMSNGHGTVVGNRPQAQWLVTCLCRSGEGQVQEIANLATGWEILLVLDGDLRPLLTSTPQSEPGPPLR